MKLTEAEQTAQDEGSNRHEESSERYRKIVFYIAIGLASIFGLIWLYGFFSPKDTVEGGQLATILLIGLIVFLSGYFVPKKPWHG